MENNRSVRPRLGYSSKYKRVQWRKSRNCWVATISVNKRRKWLGQFINEDAAGAAYNAAAIHYFGEFAFLNSIPSPPDVPEKVLVSNLSKVTPERGVMDRD